MGLLILFEFNFYFKILERQLLPPPGPTLPPSNGAITQSLAALLGIGPQQGTPITVGAQQASPILGNALGNVIATSPAIGGSASHPGPIKFPAIG